MIQFGMREIGIGAIIVLSVVAASTEYSTELHEVRHGANTSFANVVRELEREPVASQPKGDPKEQIRSAMNEMATSLAPVAIQVSLLPRDLLDHEMIERQIRGQLENQLGDGWTVEVICYAGWCNIKLIHAIGEIWVDANHGLATKSVYLH
jgi:hypothetical protein